MESMDRSKGGRNIDVIQGRNVTNDMVTHQSDTQRTSSTKRSKGSLSTNLNQKIIEASSLRRFTFNDLKLATRNFESKNVLGEGGFGTVLKGWVNEHGNFAARPRMGIPVAVKTLNPNGFQGHKEWLIAIGAANALAFLHEEASRPVIFRDFKTSNVLLDKVIT
ncbi:hypothetical protein JHK86_035598 [Glycine max]|nr:hypothetical protein JHK86_035598 [Glycine max]